MNWKAFYSRKMHEALISGSHSYILGKDDRMYLVVVDGKECPATFFVHGKDTRKNRWSDDRFVGEFDIATIKIVRAIDVEPVSVGGAK